MSAAAVATAGLYVFALYAGHHVGDYWVQTNHQACHKGDAGPAGRWACAAHVASYTATQAACLILAALVGARPSVAGVLVALAISAGTHYLADRREHSFMFWLAGRLGKAAFMELGKPRAAAVIERDEAMGVEIVCTDNPQLATGAWALDQSWHIFWGVYVAALVLAGLS